MQVTPSESPDFNRLAKELPQKWSEERSRLAEKERRATQTVRQLQEKVQQFSSREKEYQVEISRLQQELQQRGDTETYSAGAGCEADGASEVQHWKSMYQVGVHA